MTNRISKQLIGEKRLLARDFDSLVGQQQCDATSPFLFKNISTEKSLDAVVMQFPSLF